MATDDIDTELNNISNAVEFNLTGAIKSLSTVIECDLADAIKSLSAAVENIAAAQERIAECHEDCAKAWHTLVEYIINNDWK